MKVVLYRHESFCAYAISSKKNEGHLLAQTPSTYKILCNVFECRYQEMYSRVTIVIVILLKLKSKTIGFNFINKVSRQWLITRHPF